jgi:hypothetical protein
LRNRQNDQEKAGGILWNRNGTNKIRGCSTIAERHMAKATVDRMLAVIVQGRSLDDLQPTQHKHHQGDQPGVSDLCELHQHAVQCGRLLPVAMGRSGLL